MSDTDDLAASLVLLSELSNGERPTRDILGEVAAYAVQAIPGADGAGLTMLDANQPQTVVASAEFVREVDDAQYSLGEGPCLLAVATSQTQTSGSLGGEARWPRFGPRVASMGVHSVLSLPLLVPGQVIGALNVYAHSKHAFSARAVALGEQFARPAAVSVHNAQTLAAYQRLAAQLTEALTSRAVIDQALGIIMSRTGADPEEAFARLSSMSQSQQAKAVLVARSIVEEAVRRARARTADPTALSPDPPDAGPSARYPAPDPA